MIYDLINKAFFYAINWMMNIQRMDKFLFESGLCLNTTTYSLLLTKGMANIQYYLNLYPTGGLPSFFLPQPINTGLLWNNSWWRSQESTHGCHGLNGMLLVGDFYWGEFAGNSISLLPVPGSGWIHHQPVCGGGLVVGGDLIKHGVWSGWDTIEEMSGEKDILFGSTELVLNSTWRMDKFESSRINIQLEFNKNIGMFGRILKEGHL